MSRITDVIVLQVSYSGDWGLERLSIINKYLESQNMGSLVDVRDERIKIIGSHGELVYSPWYSGGGKGMIGNMAVGGFNHLDVAGFLEFLKNQIPWNRDDDGACQVVILDEYADLYEMVSVYSPI